MSATMGPPRQQKGRAELGWGLLQVQAQGRPHTTPLTSSLCSRPWPSVPRARAQLSACGHRYTQSPMSSNLHVMTRVLGGVRPRTDPRDPGRTWCAAGGPQRSPWPAPGSKSAPSIDDLRGSQLTPPQPLNPHLGAGNAPRAPVTPSAVGWSDGVSNPLVHEKNEVSCEGSTAPSPCRRGALRPRALPCWVRWSKYRSSDLPRGLLGPERGDSVVPPVTLLPSKTLAFPTSRDFDFWQGRCPLYPFSPGKTRDLNSFPQPCLQHSGVWGMLCLYCLLRDIIPHGAGL